LEYDNDINLSHPLEGNGLICREIAHATQELLAPKRKRRNARPGNVGVERIGKYGLVG
jgi:hypothetical protein